MINSSQSILSFCNHMLISSSSFPLKFSNKNMIWLSWWSSQPYVVTKLFFCCQYQTMSFCHIYCSVDLSNCYQWWRFANSISHPLNPVYSFGQSHEALLLSFPSQLLIVKSIDEADNAVLVYVLQFSSRYQLSYFAFKHGLLQKGAEGPYLCLLDFKWQFYRWIYGEWSILCEVYLASAATCWYLCPPFLWSLATRTWFGFLMEVTSHMMLIHLLKEVVHSHPVQPSSLVSSCWPCGCHHHLNWICLGFK